MDEAAWAHWEPGTGTREGFDLGNRHGESRGDFSGVPRVLADVVLLLRHCIFCTQEHELLHRVIPYNTETASGLKKPCL